PYRRNVKRSCRLDARRTCAANTGVMDVAELQKLTDWLIDGGRPAHSPKTFMAECCERMVAAGLPLWRVGVFVRTLHPEIYGRNFIWKPGAEVELRSGGSYSMHTAWLHT